MTLLLRLIKDVLESSTYGNSALKTLIDGVYTRIGAPIGASISADIAAAKANLVTLLADTVIIKAEVTNFLQSDSHLVYPTLAADVTIAGGAGAWALGALVEIIPAATIATDYYVDSVYISAVSGAQKGELVLVHGAGDTEFARIREVGVAGGSIVLPAVKKIPANDRVKAKLATSAGGAQTADVGLGYHL